MRQSSLILFLSLVAFFCGAPVAFAKSRDQFLLLGNTKVAMSCLAFFETDTAMTLNEPFKKMPLSACQKIAVSENGNTCIATSPLCAKEYFPDGSCPRPPAECGDSIKFGGRTVGLIGNIGDTYLIRDAWSGGGSGSFSSILSVVVGSDPTAGPVLENPARMHLGDRASGELEKAEVKNGALYYSVSMSAAEFLGAIGIGSNYRHEVIYNQDYGDVEYCAVCGYATANYVAVPPLFDKPRLESIELPATGNKDPRDKDFFADYAHLNDYWADGRKTLDRLPCRTGGAR